MQDAVVVPAEFIFIFCIRNHCFSKCFCMVPCLIYTFVVGFDAPCR